MSTPAQRFERRYGHAPTPVELEEYVAEGKRPEPGSPDAIASAFEKLFHIPLEVHGVETGRLPRTQLVEVHASDEEPCERSPLDHDDLVCVHGQRLVEVYR